MKTADLKKIAQGALASEYGFAPTLESIRLMESNDNGTYIAFTVKGRYYSFRSYRWADGSVWVGSGTVEKQPEYDLIQ